MSWELRSWELAKQEAFDSSPARKATSQQPRGKDFRIVQNEKIAWAQAVRDARKHGVLDLTAVPAQHQQARVAPHSGRLLRY